MSHSTVAHKWFHQIGNARTKSNSFSSGNMFYNEKIIYSYGHHFALAIRFDNMVLFNSNGYSSSTGKHQGHTRNSIDTYTHNVIYVPFKRADNFRYDVKQKDVYKYIDFKCFVNDFEENIKKLGNARKPQIYLGNIKDIKDKIHTIFATFRGSKTHALKETKGLRKLLNFEFDENTQIKLKNLAKARLEKQRKQKEKFKKESLKDLLKYENGESFSLKYGALTNLELNTVIRVKDNKIETSKGTKIDLNEGLRVFNLWENGKAIGTTINTMGGTWTCSKANGIIKFGCHEINYDQAKRVLTPYLK